MIRRQFLKITTATCVMKSNVMAQPKEIPFPKLTRTQYVVCAILFAKAVCPKSKWNHWANNWLNGSDRTDVSASKTYTDTYYDYKEFDTDSYKAASYACTAADSIFDAAFYARKAVHSSIQANPDAFTLDTMINLINQAQQY